MADAHVDVQRFDFHTWILATDETRMKHRFFKTKYFLSSASSAKYLADNSTKRDRLHFGMKLDKKVACGKHRLIVLSVIVATGMPLMAHAQLGGTNVDGVQIDVRAIYRNGDSRDLDCDVILVFSGEKIDLAFKMSQARVIRAVDDKGANLVRTNRQHNGSDFWPPMRLQRGFTQTIILKAPVVHAHTIAHLEGEAEMFTRTGNSPVITNFLARSGKVLHQPLLDKYQVKITEVREPTNALILPPAITIRVEDPFEKLESVVLQKADGTLLSPKSILSSPTEPHVSLMVYLFHGGLPHDLQLLANLAVPETSRKIRFNLENIRLPWWEPADLEVTASEVTKIEVKNTNTYACQFLLTFSGGQIAGSTGIRKLFFTRAESESGQSFKINDSYRWMMDSFSPLEDSGAGRCVQMQLPLETQTAHPRAIRNLEGEAEVYCPSPTNGGIVVFNGFVNHPGEALHDDVLTRCGVKLTYVGRDNFETRKKDWQVNRTTFIRGVAQAKLRENIKDSLQFLVEDPERRIIKHEFLDEKGQWLPADEMIGTDSLTTTTSRQLHIFDYPPSDGTQLRIYLATPESLQRVKFKVNDIPL
jgi:hypothetical protein